MYCFTKRGHGETLESREASVFFLELLDLATSSATLESEEMEAVIQNKNEKKCGKTPGLGEEKGVKGQATKKEKTYGY